MGFVSSVVVNPRGVSIRSRVFLSLLGPKKLEFHCHHWLDACMGRFRLGATPRLLSSFQIRFSIPRLALWLVRQKGKRNNPGKDFFPGQTDRQSSHRLWRVSESFLRRGARTSRLSSAHEDRSGEARRGDACEEYKGGENEEMK